MASEAQPHIIVSDTASEHAHRLEIFAARLFSGLTPDLAARLSAEQRSSLSADALEFFSVRAEPVKVRVLSAPDNGGGRCFAETVMEDCPFIIDSILEYFHHLGIAAGLLVHPVLHAARDAAGRLVSLEGMRSTERPESFVHLELRLDGGDHDSERIAAGLKGVLEQVRAATGDFEAMTTRALEICEETAAQRELVEVRDLLRWLVGGGFVFLGYRRYRVAEEGGRRTLEVDFDSPNAGLGLLRDFSRSRYARPVDLKALKPDHQKMLFEGPALIMGKTHTMSQVHRRGLMDDVTIRRTASDGRVVGFDRFVGLFTSKAYSEEAQHIPVLRAKLRDVIEAEHAALGSHNYKELVSAFNSFPKEELFRAPVNELREELHLILDHKDEAAVRVSAHYDPVRNNVVALVVLPRETFSAEVRKQIQEAIGRILDGQLVYYYLAMGEGYRARMHFCYDAAPPTATQLRAMETEVSQLARTWQDRLREELVERFGERRGQALAQRWAGAFSLHYKASTPVARAADDIERVESLFESGQNFSVELARQGASDGTAGAVSELRMFEVGEPLRLSDVMPMLSNFGITVISEEADELRIGSNGTAERAFVQSFRVQDAHGAALESISGASMVPEALTAVRSRQTEDGPLNALVLHAGLGWREIALLRTYVAAAFQMRLGPALPALRRVLLVNPKLARMLVEIFQLRMDPAGAGSGDSRYAGLRAAYLEALGAVDNIADDRIARALLGMVEATVRTNYFLEPLPPYITLKFETAGIPNLPDTPPLYEIHVDSPTMQGCHLRAGRIARGGIRYSDRPEDFRTEILDLMKTQTVKNAIIVPTGAKGGFIVKPRPGRATTHDDVVDAYTTLIRAMLELTDNVVGNQIVHPAGVKVLDQDGPYLVVAADKGTASFSDLANAIAAERKFWLDDAFASGGRYGYDHKAMGITARGVWESIRWHLREMGIDLARGAPITMVGIGDMSGDVFGNGLLQSDNIKLIAAFDHRHIFIDPDPDPKKSFAERKRLFELPSSQWSDYNPALISPGGGVFRRGAKSIALSPQARRALSCAAEVLDGDSLIQAILRADVTLLYNGGVGTYVRASAERDAEVGDHANDTCRVAANELRVKAVAEGGNLGFTQRARIEYAMAGGRINTDAIDNSAGVDTSDHEVNLKILLQRALSDGRIDFDRRNRALSAAADEVAALVLRDNRDQVVLLSLEQIRSRTEVKMFRDHLSAIEQRGVLNRYESALPSHEELRDRRSRFPGLTRPELAVLSAYTKIDMSKQLESCALPDDSYLTERFLVTYFPASIARDFAAEIPQHGLRRELISTRLVNEMVDLMGSTFVFRLTRSHGARTEDAVRAWIFAEGVLELVDQAEGLRAGSGGQGAQAELAALLALESAARRACGWAITALEPNEPLGDAIARYKSDFQKLCAQFENMLADDERERFERSYRELRSTVYTEQVAHQLARLGFADHLLNVLSLSFAHGAAPAECARAYFALGDIIEFAKLEGALEAIGTDDRWERRAAEDLGSDLRNARLALCRAVLVEREVSPAEAVRALRNGRERMFDTMAEVMNELRTLPTVGLPALEVVIRALTRLAAAATGAEPA